MRPVTRTRAVLLVSLFLSLWTGSLYLRADLDPPPGRVFAGTFHWIDDFYNYASYIQQSEDGAFFFRNKLLEPARTRAELVNLEWWTLGKVSLALGRRPFLAFRLLALVATFAFVAGAERWLARAGVPPSHRMAALALVTCAGGFGGLLFEFTDLPALRCLDLAVAAFPFVEILANPHFLTGTALLVWGLWCFVAVPAPAGPLGGIALGTVLGLVRPYDLVLLGLVRGTGVLVTEPRTRWVRSLLPLLGLLPVLAWNVWLFFLTDQFASFRSGSVLPPAVDFIPAFAPALVLALLFSRPRPPDPAPDTRKARTHLWLWAAVAAAVVVAARGAGAVGVLRTGGFSLQLLVGAGMPLLVLGAVGLARFPPTVTVLATLLLSTSAVVATRIALTPEDPNWFVPRLHMATGLALRATCRPGGDLALAPPDIGLYAIGLSACHAYVSHPAGPEYASRVAEVRAFYASDSPGVRRALLDRHRVTHLVLPGDPGPRPVGWLGGDTEFRAVAHVGSGLDGITVYSRPLARSGAGTAVRVR
jgi:hypothetical protein